MKRFVCLFVALLLVGLSLPAYAAADDPDPLFVAPVGELPEGFLLGMDVSSVLAEENSGVVYRNRAGEPEDVFRILAGHGVNTVRVRVWNRPYDDAGHGYGGGNADIDTAVALGKRATAAGLGLIVDFHFSDFWADPGKQMCPVAWQGMEIEEKTEAAYRYTRESLLRLRDAGVHVVMVQIGNETNGALAGEKIWFNIQYLMQAGARAVREVYPEALVALHFANPEKASAYADYAKKLNYYAVDYDVFATSYYPYWHGTLDNLASVLSSVALTYGKKVMVMETGYAYTEEDTDFFPNTVGAGSAVEKPYPFSVQGQANAFRDVVDTIANRTKNGIGVMYWEGAWISVGGESREENEEKWEAYGSGWATHWAKSYDPNDAGKYYGGCACDNQAMFDKTGRPLASLAVFSLLEKGQTAPLRADALEEAYLTADIGGNFALPATVNAIMNDNSRQPVPVVWDADEAALEAMREKGLGTYTVRGTADGKEAVCTVKLIRFNYLINDSFETGDLTGWTVNDLRGADELYVEEKKSDSLSGTHHMHFWSARQDSVEFTLEQTPALPGPGAYTFTVSIMGGDAGAQEIYMYIRLDGEIAVSAPLKITSFNNWDTQSVTAELGEGQTLTVGVYVKAQGSGKGAWGKIDDAVLNAGA